MNRPFMFRIIGMFFLCMLLAACQPVTYPEILDSFSDTDTAQVCWRDICPGTTAREEALRLLTSYGDIAITTQDAWHPVSPSVGWTWAIAGETKKQSSLVGEFRNAVTDNTVSFLTINVDELLTLAEVVNHFGEPSQVFAFQGGTHKCWLALYLRYPEKGIFVGHAQPECRSENTLTLKSNLLVEGITLFAVNRIDELDPKLAASPSIYPYEAWPGWDAEIEIADW